MSITRLSETLISTDRFGPLHQSHSPLRMASRAFLNTEPPKLSASTVKDERIIALVKQSQSPVPWCDEFENMISGVPYITARSELMGNHKVHIRRQLAVFNDPTIPEGTTLKALQARRMAVAQQMFGKLAADSNIEAPMFCTYGCNTTVGTSVYINRGINIYDTAPVTIGDGCIIGPGVSIHTDNHGTDIALRRQGHNFAKPVVISNDCWIGAGVAILPGVTIGKGCTIGAGAVVTGDIEPFTVAVGVPARAIKAVEDPDSECYE